MDIFCTNSFRRKSCKKRRNDRFRTNSKNEKASNVIYDVLTSHFALVTILVLYSVIGASIFYGIAKMDEYNYWWSFGDSWYYIMTILTTVGYGNYRLITQLGRGITMIYALFGIPLYFTIVLDIGIYCSKGIRCIYIKVKGGILKKIEHGDQSESYVPAVIAFVVAILYMLLGALMFYKLENQHWNYLESLYFVFMSLSSIGFGDFCPTSMKYIVIYWVYIVLGQIFVAVVVVCFVRPLLANRQDTQHKANEVVLEI